MEFMNRSGRPSQTVSAPAANSAGNGGHHKRGAKLGGLGIANVILAAGLIALLVGVILLMGFGRPATEASRVDKDRLQAVFLNGGQVYFGEIEDLTKSHIRLKGIYYLRVNQQVQPNQEDAEQQASSNDISLVKLGCELHGPEDEMLINREQVIFWENLKTDGQVAEAVAEYQKANPNGQNCDTAQQSTQPAGSTQPSQDEDN